MIIVAVLQLLIILYIGHSLFFLAGNIRSNYKKRAYRPRVTVIVPARNEADTILTCLSSLSRLIYPSDKLEIIIVNDRSDDATGTIIEKFITSHAQFKYWQITAWHPALSGKAGAISHAIKQSHGEIIFITDADCIVPATWIEETVKYFAANVGIVAGFAMTIHPDGKASFFSKLQALDWVYLLSIASGAANWNIPLSCIGNNFTFRRQAYQEVGGYEGVGFSVTEDFALLQAIRLTNRWRIVFPINAACLVYSKPLARWNDFLQQRKRWAFGGRKIRIFGKFIMALGITTHLLILLIPMIWQLSRITLVAMGGMLIADFILLAFSLWKLKHLKLLTYYPLFRIFYLFYLLLIPILMLIDRKIVWKGIQYSTR